MTTKSLLLLILSIVGLLCLASAQQTDIKFTALTTKEGLSSNTVNAIIKDRYGLVWFATQDGLNKFDGTNFKVYRHKTGDSSSLQSNEILALHEDKAGNLWVGTGGGSLSLYNRKSDAFVNFPANQGPNSIINNVILDVSSDYLGKIWIASYGGVNMLDLATKRISKLPVSSNRPDSFFTKVSICLFEDSR